MENKYVNLCPHPVKVRRVDGNGWDFFPAAVAPARAYGDVEVVGVEDGYIFKDVAPGKAIVVNVPDEQEGIRYIVSSVIRRDMPHRTDLVVPVPIKDNTGRTIGAEGFFAPYGFVTKNK